MEKRDFKKTLKTLYAPSAKDFSLVDVPQMQFVMIDGVGDPNTSKAFETATQWLYGTSYPLKFISKKQMQKDYVVPPLEGLWWADDMNDFVTGSRENWKWTLMIMAPDWITSDMFNQSVEKAMGKMGERPDSIRLEAFAEGQAAQIMHVGPYSEEAPTIARLHDEFLPQNGLTENGLHHEIYLSDPRKTAPEKMKTVLRQPVKDV